MVEPTDEELAAMTPAEYREACRTGRWSGYSVFACRGYAQNNLAIVPWDAAFEFLTFCHRNPRPCPVVDITEPGSPHPPLVAPDADLRTDLPRYRVFIEGELVDEPTDILEYWRDDLVAFLIGAGPSFAWALRSASLDFRLLGDYHSTIQCVPAGRFRGPMVISGWAFRTSRDAVRAIQISSRHLASHGPPIHIGDPAPLGVADITAPEVPIDPIPAPDPGDVLLWWGCGVTPQTVALAARLPIFMSHMGGHTFMNDLTAEETANL